MGQKCLSTPQPFSFDSRAGKAVTAGPLSSLFLEVSLCYLLNVLLQHQRMRALLLHKSVVIVLKRLDEEPWAVYLESIRWLEKSG